MNSNSSFGSSTHEAGSTTSTLIPVTSNPPIKVDPVLNGKCVEVSNKTGVYFRISWKLPLYNKVDAKRIYSNVTIKLGKSFKTFRVTSSKDGQFFDYKSDESFMVAIRFCSKICSAEVDVTCSILSKSSSEKAEGAAPVVGASIGGVIVLLAVIVGVAVVIKKGAFSRFRRGFKNIDEKCMEKPLDLTSEKSSFSMGFENELYNSTSEV